jgi:hypothetical protein
MHRHSCRAWQERVIYNKEVQTTEIATEPIVIPEEDIVQQLISREQQEAEQAAVRDKELEEEAFKLEKEIEDEIRGTTYSIQDLSAFHCFILFRIDGRRTSQHLHGSGVY